MTPRRITQGALALVAVALIAIWATDTGHAYTIDLRVPDAQGLAQGSQVVIGGVKVGTVSSLRLTAHGGVLISLSLDKSQSPVGRDATVAIASQNLLGQKEVALTRGNLRSPAPSGFVVPSSRITVSTDLDQVLDVLDANTRARLAILVNEAGAALVGQRGDISKLLAQFPSSLADTTAVLNQLVSDNHSLANAVRSSDQFISTVVTKRTRLTRLIGVLGQAAETVAARRAALGATLQEAPETLLALQGLLSTLQRTSGPLGPAARLISAMAPSLLSTLGQLTPLRRAADPALREATAIAPSLSQLAIGATPVLQRLRGTTEDLATFATALKPTTATLNSSEDNIIAIVQNWSRAIQFRDGLSHVFRGSASITPATLTSLVGRLLGGTTSAPTSSSHQPVSSAPKPAKHTTTTVTATSTQTTSTATSPSTLAGSVGGLLGGVLGAVTHTLGRTAGAGGSGVSTTAAQMSGLLNYLLGK